MLPTCLIISSSTLGDLNTKYSSTITSKEPWPSMKFRAHEKPSSTPVGFPSQHSIFMALDPDWILSSCPVFQKYQGLGTSQAKGSSWFT